MGHCESGMEFTVFSVLDKHLFLTLYKYLKNSTIKYTYIDVFVNITL